MPDELDDDDIVILSDEDYYFLKFVADGYISREQMLRRYADSEGRIRIPITVEESESSNHED